MKVVAAALSDDVDHAARGAAILRFESAALDLNFADKFKRNRALTSECCVTNIRDFNTVDNESVLGTACAVNRVPAHAAAGVVSGGASGTGRSTASSGVKQHTGSSGQN